MLQIKGVGLGAVTPFTKDNQIDVEGIRRNLDFALRNGVHSINPAATSGEGSLLSLDEYEKVVRTVVEHVDGKVPVTPGAPGGAPAPITKLIRLAKDLGADGAYLSTPAYTKPTQEGLLAHFTQILRSVDLPIVIYNAVHRSGVDMSPDVVGKLSKQFSHFVGYKEPSLMKMGQIKYLTEDRIQLISEDWLFLPALALCASGVASVVANIVPKMMVDIYYNFTKGRMQEARTIQISLLPLMDLIGIGAGGRDTSPSPIKAAMDMLGLAAGPPRLPLVSASEETKAQLKAMLAKIMPSMKMN